MSTSISSILEVKGKVKEKLNTNFIFKLTKALLIPNSSTFKEEVAKTSPTKSNLIGYLLPKEERKILL